MVFLAPGAVAVGAGVIILAPEVSHLGVGAPFAVILQYGEVGGVVAVHFEHHAVGHLVLGQIAGAIFYGTVNVGTG